MNEVGNLLIIVVNYQFPILKIYRNPIFHKISIIDNLNLLLKWLQLLFMSSNPMMYFNYKIYKNLTFILYCGLSINY
jgi:hypothetical protein